LQLNELAMSLAGKNLRYLRKLRGWTQEEFANRLGIKRSLLGAYEEERAEPKLEVTETVCGLFKLSMEEFLLKDMSAAKGMNYLEKRRQMKMAGTPNVAEIQFVPMKAAAGYLAGYGDPDFIDELNTFTLPMMAPGQYRAFEILGDSMLPTPSGSVIVCEKVDDVDEVKNSQAYIVVSKSEGIVYKRVVKNRTKAKLTLVSDNPQFEPYNINSDDVLEMWKAVYVLSKAQTQPRWDMNQLATVVNNLQEQVSTLKKKLN
jgi:transcriptional regulator with XRE-family HTH domain